jgi:hypothetical protein
MKMYQGYVPLSVCFSVRYLLCGDTAHKEHFNAHLLSG